MNDCFILASYCDPMVPALYWLGPATCEQSGGFIRMAKIRARISRAASRASKATSKRHM